jgi:hypothetical protein
MIWLVTDVFFYSVDNSPAGPEKPMIVGAQSKFEALLLFMRDETL